MVFCYAYDFISQFIIYCNIELCGMCDNCFESPTELKRRSAFQVTSFGFDYNKGCQTQFQFFSLPVTAAAIDPQTQSKESYLSLQNISPLNLFDKNRYIMELISNNINTGKI